MADVRLRVCGPGSSTLFQSSHLQNGNSYINRVAV